MVIKGGYYYMRRLTKEMKIKMMEIWEESVKKQIEFEKLSAEPMNYQIIQDLVNSARQGVRIEVTLKDGSKMVIKQETPYDSYKDETLF
jgi:hypothetical protein